MTKTVGEQAPELKLPPPAGGKTRPASMHGAKAQSPKLQAGSKQDGATPLVPVVVSAPVQEILALGRELAAAPDHLAPPVTKDAVEPAPSGDTPREHPDAEVAFSLRLQPQGQSAAPASPPDQRQGRPEPEARALTPDLAKPSPAPGNSPADERTLAAAIKTIQNSSPVFPISEQAEAPRTESHQPNVQAPQKPAETEAPADPQAVTKVAPPKQITLRVDDGDKPAAEIRVLERGSQVQVSVRTSDPEFARSLRSDLGDLVSNLNNHGIRAESVSTGSNSASSSNHSATSDREPNPDSSKHPKDSGHRDRDDQASRRQWLEELKKSRSAAMQSTGEITQ